MQQGMENTSTTRQSFGRLAILIAVAAIDLLGATMVFPQIPFYAKHFNAYYRRTGTAGQPGHGPYPTHHDPIIGRAQFREFAAEHGFDLEHEVGFRRLPRVQQIFTTAVSLLTLRRLASSHIDLCYIARRVPDAAASGAPCDGFRPQKNDPLMIVVRAQ